MRAIRIVLIAMLLALLAFIAGTAYLAAYLDEHRDLLADSVSTVLGREVRIEQGVSVQWSLTPAISLDGLWIGNPAWAKGEFLARAEHALLRIRLPGLLHKRLDLRQVTIRNADIALEEAEDGSNNWSFGGDGDSGFGLSLDALKAENSRLSYRMPSGEMRRTDVPEVELKGLGGRELEFRARLTYREIPVTAFLESRSQAISQAGERPFRGEIEMPGTTLRVSGELKGLLEFAKLDLTLDSERLDLQKSVFAAWYAMPVVGTLAKIDGRFTTAGDSYEALLGNLEGRLKVGSATIEVPGKKGEQATELGLNSLDLAVAPKQPVRLQSEIVYQKQPYQIELEGGRMAELIGAKESWRALKFKSAGEYQGRPFEAKGELGPLAAVTAGRNLNVKLNAKLGELDFRGDGKLASLAGVQGSQLKVSVSGPSLSRLTPWLDVSLPESAPFEFNSQLIAGEKTLQLKALNLTTAGSDLSGDLNLPLVAGGRVDGSLRSKILDLNTLLDPGEGAKAESVAEELSLLERELPVVALGQRDGSLKLKIGRLRLRAIEFEAVEFDWQLDGGHLKLAAKAEGERVTADVDLNSSGTEWQLAIRHSSAFELGDLIDRGRHADDRSNSPVSIDADLKGTGRSLRAVIESLEGRFTMVMGQGRLSEAISGHLPMGDVVYAVLEVIDPRGVGQRQANLECAVIHLQVAQGVATSPHGLAMRTDQMNLLGGGTLQLRSGAIDLEFKTAQRKGLGLVGVADRFVRLTGTLQEPVVGVNAKSAIVHGTAAWATGGLSLLVDGAFRRLTASANPCEAVQKAIDK